MHRLTAPGKEREQLVRRDSERSSGFAAVKEGLRELERGSSRYRDVPAVKEAWELLKKSSRGVEGREGVVEG